MPGRSQGDAVAFASRVTPGVSFKASRQPRPQPFHKGSLQSALVALGESKVKAEPASAPMHCAKKAGFPHSHRSTSAGPLDQEKSRRNVADLINPELPRLNRFSSHSLHSDALTQIHDMPGSTIVTSFGRVISVRGSIARLGLLATGQLAQSDVRATVGRFVSIRCAATSTIIAMITEVSCENVPTSDIYIATASVDLLGEILGGPERPKFQRGVTNYPTIGDSVELITHQDLRTVYAPVGSDQIDVGTLQQDASVTAYVDVEELLSKHFAILGSTGVGKSTGVSLLLNEILKPRPSLRIFLLDVHNEYGRCFGERALVLNPRNLKLPFWLFNFEEIVDVLFGGRSAGPEELEILAESFRWRRESTRSK